MEPEIEMLAQQYFDELVSERLSPERELMESAVPDYTLEAIRNYVDHGLPPGGFLYAVLTNNLVGSFARADSTNRKALFDIVSYVYNELPSACWGNEEKVKNWLNAKAEQRNSGLEGAQ